MRLNFLLTMQYSTKPIANRVYTNKLLSTWLTKWPRATTELYSPTAKQYQINWYFTIIRAVAKLIQWLGIWTVKRKKELFRGVFSILWILLIMLRKRYFWSGAVTLKFTMKRSGTCSAMTLNKKKTWKSLLTMVISLK